MDYGKYRYEQEQKAKLARKHQTQINVKEIKLRPKIGIHDYNTKKGHVERFLNQRAKVKVTIMFQGPGDDPSRARPRPADAARGGRPGDRSGRIAAAARRAEHDAWCWRRRRTQESKRQMPKIEDIEQREEAV